MAFKRVATVFKVAPENLAEYKRRHDEIWPELTEAINYQGIHNYTIWYFDGQVFSYYEIDESAPRELPVWINELFKRWDDYMKDILTPVLDENTGEQIRLPLMFYHK